MGNAFIKSYALSNFSSVFLFITSLVGVVFNYKNYRASWYMIQIIQTCKISNSNAFLSMPWHWFSFCFGFDWFVHARFTSLGSGFKFKIPL